MIHETPKPPIQYIETRQKRVITTLAEWQGATHVDPVLGIAPDFQGGSDADFLEWLLAKGTVFATNISMLRWLRATIPELCAWSVGWQDRELMDGRGWLRWKDYRLFLSRNGNQLTVQKGKKYARYVDVGGIDWRALAPHLEAAGIHKLSFPSSTGTVAADLLDWFVGRNLTTEKLPPEVAALAWQACKGSRMEALTLGTLSGYAADINSAFPSAARDLPRCDDPRFCEWRPSNTYQPDADYGLAYIDVDLPDWEAGPLGIRVDEEEADGIELCFPVGQAVNVAVSKPDMDLLHDLDIPFTINQGWWGYAKSDVYPFRALMNTLWNLRSADKATAKLLSVACVGQLGSARDDEDGQWHGRPFFAPVYFAHIYADIRSRIFRKALRVGLDRVHAFTVDGLIADAGIPIGQASDFGTWRQESEGQYFLTGDYFKDRPGDDGHGRWRDAVASTPETVAPDHFQSSFDFYVDLPAMWARRDYKNFIGESLPEIVTLPLGPTHRTAVRDRQIYLISGVPTAIMRV